MPEEIFADPSDTRAEILAATYRALCEHGYADLTISVIGEEFEKSPSLVYRHYDSKDDLVLSCLEYMLETLLTQFERETVTDPRARLEELAAWSLGEIPDDRREYFAVLSELRTLAVQDDAYRAHFTESDQLFAEYVADLIRMGIEMGEFQECDADRLARFLVSSVWGGVLRRSTCEPGSWLADLHREQVALLEERVYRS